MKANKELRAILSANVDRLKLDMEQSQCACIQPSRLATQPSRVLHSIGNLCPYAGSLQEAYATINVLDGHDHHIL